MQLASPKRIADRKLAILAKLGLPLASIVGLIAFTVAFYEAATASTYTLKVVDDFCDPNGKPHVKAKDCSNDYNYNQYWDPSLFLSVTLGCGDLQYTSARVIDIFWDLVVGRGGQAVLALLAYPVVRRSLRVQMERGSVHFKVFAALAFEKISSAALWATIRDFAQRSKISH